MDRGRICRRAPSVALAPRTFGLHLRLAYSDSFGQTWDQAFYAQEVDASKEQASETTPAGHKGPPARTWPSVYRQIGLVSAISRMITMSATDNERLSRGVKGHEGFRSPLRMSSEKLAHCSALAKLFGVAKTVPVVKQNDGPVLESIS